MHLTVGYLATPTGDDGVALARALATTFGADVDVVLVVREELPDGHPGRAEYQHFLIERGEKWIAAAVAALSGVGNSVGSTVLVGESYAESLIDFAESKSSDLIVIGGARDGMFGGHVIGSVAGELLHCSPIPVALAPRGYADDPPGTITAITAAVPTREGADNPLPFSLTLASAGHLPIRLVSLVSLEHVGEDQSALQVRTAQIAAAEKNLDIAARSLPDAPDIDSLVADGSTLESAMKKLNWSAGDVLLVGSGRLAAPRRVFLGSTAARILAGTDIPVIVVPRGER